MAEKASDRLRRYSKQIPSEDAMRRIVQNLEREDTDYADYAIALICATFVEKALEAAILAHLAPFDEAANKRLFEYENRGPISDFSAKIKLAYSLGIFGEETKRDLDVIREIRNVFAHSGQSTSFKTDEVAEMCKLFKVQPAVRVVIVGVESTARQKYVKAATTIGGRLKIALERQPAVEASRVIGRFRRVLK
jgi:hypothetical protein